MLENKLFIEIKNNDLKGFECEIINEYEYVFCKNFEEVEIKVFIQLFSQLDYEKHLKLHQIEFKSFLFVDWYDKIKTDTNHCRAIFVAITEKYKFVCPADVIYPLVILDRKNSYNVGDLIKIIVSGNF